MKEVRKHLGIEPDDKINFVLHAEGDVTLKTTNYPTITSLRGAAGKLKAPLAWEEMRQIARDDHITRSDDFSRSLSDND